MSPLRGLMRGVWSALGVALLAASPSWAEDCGFARPPGWQGGRVAWFGPCAAGRAEGLGVLRAYHDGKPADAFFGRMTKGVMVSGVMETAEGFAAGRFEAGQAVETDDRQVLIDAFRSGADAARAASALFRQQKNPGSAKFYADKAEQLARQMD